MKKNKSTTSFFILMLAFLALAFMADIAIGSVWIPFNELLSTLFEPGNDLGWNFIIWEFRLPKALTAILVGAGLSVAGLMMQTLFRNPLAGPYVLGISSGASLGVAIFVMLLGFGSISMIGSSLGNVGLVGASILGSVLVMLLVIVVSLRVRDSVSVLIIGIMFGSITGAIVSVLQYFSDPDSVHSFLVWTFGSISGVTWKQFWFFSPLVIIGLIISFGLHKPLNAWLLGENYARGIGMNVKRSRLFLIILTSIIAGALTAFTGPIAFIGVAVPHIARSLLKTSEHKILIPAVMGIGSILMLVCDLISQLPGSSQLLPINSVTAIFGAPVVIWVITRKKS